MSNSAENDKKLSKINYIIISSLIFGLFFGAGNLIFPLHLGQLAGHNWLFASLGFLVTSVLLPLLSILAIALTHSKEVYDIGKPAGSWFALLFMVLIHLTIGPLFGTPRTATVSFTVGIAPFLKASQMSTGLLIFSAIFFIAVFCISYNQSDILTTVGKVLNPLFLVLLFLVLLVAFLFPLGKLSTAPVNPAYVTGKSSFVNGFLEGYNTLDALAGLAFGVTIVTAIKQMGKKSDQGVAFATAKSSSLSMLAVALIYLLLILAGVMSLGKFKLSADGGIAFAQIVQHYGGQFGQAVLAALIVLTCLTTAVGLVAAFAQDFHEHFPKVSYHVWLFITSLLSFLFANVGLTTIISWSKPASMLLYPIAILLIFLSVCEKFFKKSRIVYLVSVFFVSIPAIMDMIVSLPAVVSRSDFGLAVADLRNLIPFADRGLSWVIPMLLGVSIGTIIFEYLDK